MTSFAERVAPPRLAALALALLAGLSAGAAAGAPDGAFESRVLAEIARRLGRPAAAVRLDWSVAGAAGDAADSLAGVAGGPGGWFTLVAVRGGDRRARRVRAEVLEPVAVAARPLAAGTRLAPGDLRVEPRWMPAGTGGAGVPAEPGWEVRRAVPEGGALRWPAVAAPVVIEPGQRVVATWERGAVSVRHSGVALQGARAGRPVRVRLDGNSAALTALAVAPGEVRMEGGFSR